MSDGDRTLVIWNKERSVMATNASVRLCVPSSRRITTVEGLREHLQYAIELEHFTLPPYLCALYSLDSDRNPEATEVLVSILVEEMLHMTLAGNLLNAVGGMPRLY